MHADGRTVLALPSNRNCSSTVMFSQLQSQYDDGIVRG